MAKQTQIRGQAAMEYLVTYGWALIALFAVVAFLIASDAFSASNYATQECSFQPDLPCSSSMIALETTYNDPSTLWFSVTNGLGFRINVTNVTYTFSDLGISGRRTIDSATSGGELNGVAIGSAAAIPSGAYMNFTQSFVGSVQPKIHSTKQITATITYMNCKSSPCTGPYTTSGRISSRVEGYSCGGSC